MKRIGITGASGLLGSSLMRILTHKDQLNPIIIDRQKLITFNKAVSAYLDKLNLDYLIHCAANTNVEACELNPESCYQDNYTLTDYLAKQSKELDFNLVFISSTGIYGNHSDMPYCENDLIEPTTIYHKSKYFAEQAVMKQAKTPLIIRTGWLFGGASDNPKNFVANRIKEALTSNDVIHSDISQYGNPTFTDDVTQHILTLINLNLSGTFNCVSPYRTSRFEYVKMIIAISGLKNKVEPADASKFKRIAKVSNNESAVNERLQQLGLDQMPDWRHRLAEYIPILMKTMNRE